MKHPEMGRSQIIWVGIKCNHLYPRKREAEGDWTQIRIEGKVATGPELMGIQTQATEGQQPLEAGEARTRSFLSLWRSKAPASTFILDT